LPIWAKIEQLELKYSVHMMHDEVVGDLSNAGRIPSQCNALQSVCQEHSERFGA